MGHPRRSCAGPVLADPDDVSRAPEYDSADFCAVCDVLADEYKRTRDAHIHRAYIKRYGPRQ
jgi:hypothetical protein